MSVRQSPLSPLSSTFNCLPAIYAVFVLEQAASSGSSRMSQAPNLHNNAVVYYNKCLEHNTSIGVDSGISLRTTIHRFTFGRTFSPESSTCRLGDSDTNTTKKDFQQTVFPVTVRIPDSHLWLKYNFNYLS